MPDKHELEIKRLEHVLRIYNRIRDERQTEIDQIEQRIQELQSTPVEPEIDIPRYGIGWDDENGCPIMVKTDRSCYCKYQDMLDFVNELKDEINRKPKYEEETVFWSQNKERVFRLTGKLALREDDWSVGSSLTLSGSLFTLYSVFDTPFPLWQVEIIDTPVYVWYKNYYIWDGGRPRCPKKGDTFLSDTESVLKASADYNYKRKILIKLKITN